MAEYEYLPGLGTATGSSASLSVAGGDACTLATSLYPLQNNLIIKSFSLRVLTDCSAYVASRRTFKYVVIALNDYDVDDFSCLYISQAVTVTGSVGTETFTLTTPCTIPKFGRYYSGILYEYASAASATLVSTVFPTASKLPSSSDLVVGGLTFSLAVGRQIPQAEFSGTASRWLMLNQNQRPDEGLDRGRWLHSLGTDINNGYGMTVLSGKVAVIATNLIELEKCTVLRQVRIRTVEDCSAYVEARRTYKLVVISLDDVDGFVCRYISQALITSGAIGVETFELSPSYTTSPVDREFIGLMHEGAVGVASSKVIRSVYPSTSTFWNSTTLFASNPTSTVSVGRLLSDLWGNQASNFWLMLAPYTQPATTLDTTALSTATGSGGGHTLSPYREMVFSNLHRKLVSGTWVTGASIRVVSDSTALEAPSRTFRYVVLEKVLGQAAAYIRFMSNEITHTGAVGTETFSFTSYYNVPWSGDFYGGLLYTYEGTACAYVARGSLPYGAELPTAITEYLSFSSAGFSLNDLISFPVDYQLPDSWDLLSETLVLGDIGDTIRLGTDSGAGEQLSLGPNANLVACTFNSPLPPDSAIAGVSLFVVVNSQSLSAASRTFKYAVLQDSAGVKTCKFLSGAFTHTGAVGKERFVLDPPFLVPHSGTYYGALVYTNTTAPSAFIVRALFPATSTFSTSQFLQLAYPASLAVNTTLAFAGTVPLRWLMLSEAYQKLRCDWTNELGVDIDSGLTYTISSGVAAVISNFTPSLRNGATIRRVRLRTVADCTTATAASRTVKYVVIELAGGVYTCRYISQDIVLTGAAGVTTAELTSPYTVPNYGTFYGGLLYTNLAASSAYLARSVHPSTSSMPAAITRYTAFSGGAVSVGTTLTFGASGANEWIMLSEQQHDTVVNLVPDSIALSTSPADESLTSVGKSYTPAGIVATADVAVSDLTIGIPLTPVEAAVTVDLGASLTVEKILPAALDPAVSLDISIPTITINKLLVPSPIGLSVDPAATTINRRILLTPTALSMEASLETSYLPLAEFKLAEGSSRTPDAGITLVGEESGLPAGYSWYDKICYNFHLVFGIMTEAEKNRLEQFCADARVRAIDYAWPFDNHLYRCVFSSELAITPVRVSAALGNRYSAEVDLVGYEVS